MFKLITILLIISAFLSCSSEPQSIYYGEDNCSYCRMLISDSRYGSELLTGKGKAYKFDSVECMAAYILKDKKGNSDAETLWVTDFVQPGSLTQAQSAYFLHSEELGSPMSMNLTAFADLNEAQMISKKYPGKIIQWNDVKTLVTEKWLTKD